MDERETTNSLGHLEGRLVSAAIKVGKFMHIECRDEFMQHLGVKEKGISADLVHDVIDCYESVKDLPDQSAQFKRIVQLVLETNILCVMESVENFLMNHDLGWLLAVPKSESLVCQTFIERVWKTSTFHTIRGFFTMG